MGDDRLFSKKWLYFLLTIPDPRLVNSLLKYHIIMAARAKDYIRLHHRFLSTPSIHTIAQSNKYTINTYLVPSSRITNTVYTPSRHLHYNHHTRSFSNSTTTPSNNNNPKDDETTKSEEEEGIDFKLEHENIDLYERREAIQKTKKENINLEIDRSEFTEEVPFQLPDLGDGNRGKIVKWHHKEGAVIQQGDTLCDIETDVGYSTVNCFGFFVVDLCPFFVVVPFF